MAEAREAEVRAWRAAEAAAAAVLVYVRGGASLAAHRDGVAVPESLSAAPRAEAERLRGEAAELRAQAEAAERAAWRASLLPRFLRDHAYQFGDLRAWREVAAKAPPPPPPTMAEVALVASGMPEHPREYPAQVGPGDERYGPAYGVAVRALGGPLAGVAGNPPADGAERDPSDLVPEPGELSPSGRPVYAKG